MINLIDKSIKRKSRINNMGKRATWEKGQHGKKGNMAKKVKLNNTFNNKDF